MKQHQRHQPNPFSEEAGCLPQQKPGREPLLLLEIIQLAGSRRLASTPALNRSIHSRPRSPGRLLRREEWPVSLPPEAQCPRRL